MGPVVETWLDLAEPWARAFVLWSWQAVLVVAAVWISVRFNRERYASVRHLQWAMGLAAVAVLPLCSWLLAAAPLSHPSDSALQPLVLVVNLPDVVLPVSPVDPAGSAIPAATWLSGVFLAVWACGAVVCGTRSLRDHLHFRRLRLAADFSGFPKFQRPRIGRSSGVAIPVLTGILRPSILMPADIADWTTPVEREAILLHESAHFQRRDHLVNLFQSLMAAVFFFHPFVRYALRQLVVERELACDRRALACGIAPAAYADLLLRAAARGVSRRSAQLALGSSKSDLERRVEMVLSSRLDELSPRGRLAVVGRCLIAIGALVWLMAPSGTFAMREPIVFSPSLPPFALLESLARGGTSDVALPAAKTLPRGEAMISQSLPPAKREQIAAAFPPAAPQLPSAVPTQQASFSGRILDEAGGAIPNATLVLVLSGTGVVRYARSGTDGGFSFPTIEPGEYRLRAIAEGFSLNDSTVIAQPGGPTRQDLTLQVSPAQTRLEVIAPRLTLPAGIFLNGTAPTNDSPRVTSPRLIFQPKPVYPADALAVGLEADVQISVIVRKDGTVSIQEVQAGVPSDLANAAADAVKQWRYVPGTLNGTPVDLFLTVVVAFRLN